MRSSRDVKTDFWEKREESVEDLRSTTFDAQKAFEASCEETMPIREKTIVILVDEDGLQGDIISDLITECACNVETVHTEFDLFKEIGKNSIVGVIVQVGKSKHPESTLGSLLRREIPTFAIFKEQTPELDLWCKELGDCYKWPDELGVLAVALKSVVGKDI